MMETLKQSQRPIQTREARPAGRRKLTIMQRLFVGEYLIDLNATKAAERAGYSSKTAQEQASRLLSNAMVSAEIARIQKERFQRLGITAEQVLRELALIGFANMLDFVTITPDGEARVDLSRLTRDQAAAISEITVDECVDAS
jgi:phage terminase small subunit